MPVTYDSDKKRYKYKNISSEAARKQINELNVLFTDYMNRSYKNKAVRFEIDIDCLYDVVVHVDKRNEHARIFHDVEDSNEFRNIALYCYWIVRLHPFYCDTISNINESFAVYLFVCLFNSMYDKKQFGKYQINRRYIHELKYTLRYRELNKATLILLMEPRLEITTE